MKYSTRHICQLFTISPETVRAWSEEFQEYLSESARPGVGRHRQFDDDDMRVLSLITQMKSENSATFADIHEALKAGKRGRSPSLPASEVEALVLSERESQLVFQLQKQQDIIDDLERERTALLPVRDENIRLTERLRGREEQLTQLMTQSEKRVTELVTELKMAQEEIKKLNREIGRLESHVDDD